MEYVRGDTLAALLRRDGKLPIARAVEIARGIAAGLAAAHARGIVHRDLKPGNVMIADDRVVLMEFGLAQHEGETDVSGTLGYMAPEQLAGLAIDARADVYALGCVTYELVTGARVFGDGRSIEIATRHASFAPPDLRAKRPDAPRWLARAVTAMLAKQPAPRAHGMALLVDGPRRSRTIVPIVACVAAVAAVVTWRVARTGPAWQPVVENLQSYTENSDYPMFSPDGSMIAYLSDRGHPGLFRPFREARRGGDSHEIAIEPGANISRIRWGRDHTWLYAVFGGHVARQTIDAPSAPIDLGEGSSPAECGDAVLLLDETGAGARLVLRQPDGTRRTLVEVGPDEALRQPTCVSGGGEIAFARGTVAGVDIASTDVWVIDPDGTTRMLARAGAYPTFAPGGRTVVFSALRNGSINLYEAALTGGEPRRITFGVGPDLAPDISPDGRELVFDVDLGVDAVFEGDDRGRRQLTQRRESVSSAVPVPGGALLVAERVEHDGVKVISIELGDGTAHAIASGRGPFPSLDGKLVYARAADDPRRLVRVPIGGGEPVTIAELPATIVRGAAGPDGLHVELERDGRLEGWSVDDHGTLAPEGVAGLVVPAPSGGWRAIVLPGRSNLAIQLVPPGAPLTQPTQTLASTFSPTWLDDHRLGYAIAGRFRAFDVRSGESADLIAAPPDYTPAVLAPDGKHWYLSDAVGEVSRHVITNFATRPGAV
jgi:hypothetical protein